MQGKNRKSVGFGSNLSSLHPTLGKQRTLVQFSKQQFLVSIVLFIHTDIEKTHTYRFQEKIQKVSFISFRAFFKAEFGQINLSDNFRTRGFSNLSKVTEKFSKKGKNVFMGSFLPHFGQTRNFLDIH